MVSKVPELTGWLPCVGKIAALWQVGLVSQVLCACQCAAMCGGQLETSDKVTCRSSWMCPDRVTANGQVFAKAGE